jgi:hypothetical protein
MAENIIQLLHLNEIDMRFNGTEYNNIERGEALTKTTEFVSRLLFSHSKYNVGRRRA